MFFETIRSGTPERLPIVAGPQASLPEASALLSQVEGVDWSAVRHAYGPADDVAGQLAAVIAGDADTRAEAWWNLWGNIHHQGDVYEATRPAVPILSGLARWREHPDRTQALIMLREIAAAGLSIEEWVHGDAHD
jgi:hypothetical protein